MQDQTAQLLEKLADKLSTTSAHLWEIMIQAQKVHAMESAVWICVSLPVAFVMGAFCLKFVLKYYKAEGYRDSDHIFFSGAFALFMAISLTVALVNSFGYYRYTYLPEYTALSELLGHVSQK